MLLNETQYRDWVIKNVPLSLIDDFRYRRDELRDKREQYNTRTLEHILQLCKEDSMQSEEYYKRLIRDHERKEP